MAPNPKINHVSIKNLPKLYRNHWTIISMTDKSSFKIFVMQKHSMEHCNIFSGRANVPKRRRKLTNLTSNLNYLPQFSSWYCCWLSYAGLRRAHIGCCCWNQKTYTAEYRARQLGKLVAIKNYCSPQKALLLSVKFVRFPRPDGKILWSHHFLLIN